MRIQLAPSPAGAGPGHSLSTFLVDGVLAIDAGGLGMAWPPEQLAKIEHVFITHSHIDHLAGLAIFLDTVYQLGPPPTIHALPATLESMREDLFNDRLFPDFVRLSQNISPFLHLAEVHPDKPVQAGRHTLTAVLMAHPVPTVNYLIDDGDLVVALLTDTLLLPTVFARLAATPRLAAVFLECAFPQTQARLAANSGHLTPAKFAEAARIFPTEIPIYAIHIKPRYYHEVVTELKKLSLPNFRGVAEPGKVIRVRRPRKRPLTNREES
jgi:ribonuclease BN (tRNA processing enzyme)